MTERMVENAGITLATEDFGREGDPGLVLVMGSTASMLGWPVPLCQALAARGLHVVRFDHRDTGRSSRSVGETAYTVEDMCGDVLAVMEAHGMARAHLVGMSLGGLIGQMLALDAPDRLTGLSLIAAEPLGWQGAPLPGIDPRFLNHFEGFATLDWSDEAAVTEFLLVIARLCAGSAGFDEPAARDRIAADVRRAGGPEGMADAFRHGALTLRDDRPGAAARIALPVQVLHGAEDPILPVENGRALAETIPGATLRVFDGVGHELPQPLWPVLTEEIATFARRNL